MTLLTATVHYCKRCGGRMTLAWDDEVERECFACGFVTYRPGVDPADLARELAELQSQGPRQRKRTPKHGKQAL